MNLGRSTVVSVAAISAIAGGSTGALVSVAMTSPKEIRTERIRIIDQRGRTRAMLGTAVDGDDRPATLIVIDADGTLRAVFGMGALGANGTLDSERPTLMLLGDRSDKKKLLFIAP